MISEKDVIAQVAREGYAFLPRVFSQAEISKLLSITERTSADSRCAHSRGSVYAIRNLLSVAPEARKLPPPLRSIIERILGRDPKAVRGTFFDKPRTANWKVPWHQDLSITVRERRYAPGFGPWTVKDGVIHVQPPREVLQQMLAVRIHLDDCGISNAPLRVIPGSHRGGRLNAAQILELTASESVACTMNAGGVMLMRPLLLHASSAAIAPAHRRVIHLELAAGSLPAELQWNQSLDM